MQSSVKSIKNAPPFAADGKFKIVADSSPTGIGIIEPGTRTFVYVNETALKTFGYRLSEIPGIRSPDIYWDMKDRGEIVNMLKKGKTVWDFELRLKKKNGCPFWVSAFVRTISFDNKPAILCSFIDITNRKKAEESLRESENRFRALVTAGLNNAVYIMNADWSEMRYLNGSDFLADTLKPTRFWLKKYIPVEDHAGIMTIINDSIRLKSIFEIEHRIRLKDGSIGWVHTRAVPLLDEAGTIYEWFGVKNDVTEQKQLEEDLKRHSLELAAANQDLEAFAYSISHDLRNPLHSILGHCDVLKQQVAPEDADIGASIDMIAAAADKMGQIISDLMVLSRVTMQEIKLQSVSLSGLAENIVQELKVQSHGRSVTVDIRPGMLVHADEGLMRLLLENLFQNAWKFTSKRKTARIEFGKTGRGKSPVFFVRDNGAGFEMKSVDRLFKPFQRLHSEKEFKGTGIGLSIVRRIVDKHCGRVWAEAQKGKGATFYFELPSLL